MKRRIERFTRWGAFILLMFSIACEPAAIQSTYVEAILAHRVSKDLSFFDESTSVLRPSERTKFAGLNYFPVDSTFRFEVPLHSAADRTTVRLAKQKSGPVMYEVLGYVLITRGGESGRLDVFRSEEMEPGTAWIPFLDATSNRSTYGGGRYLDVELEDNDSAIVDFNLAYNPLCEYNPDDFNCTIPPSSNRLPFAVTAGEKKSGLLE